MPKIIHWTMLEHEWQIKYWLNEYQRAHGLDESEPKTKYLSLLATTMPTPRAMFFELGAITTMYLQYAEMDEYDRLAFKLIRDVSDYWDHADSLEPFVCAWPRKPRP
jgi:hypothetical protein